MKSLTLLTLLAFLPTATVAQIHVDQRKPGLDILHGTLKVLEAKVAPIDERALRYVPKDGGWSVLNCLEHLAFVERTLHENLKGLIETGEREGAEDLSGKDWLIIAQVTDRTNKVKTQAPLEPQPGMRNKGKAYFMAEIRNYREKTMALLEATKVDLRKVIGPYLYGEADALQQAIIIGAHSYRHTMQIEEILSELHSEREGK